MGDYVKTRWLKHTTELNKPVLKCDFELRLKFRIAASLQAFWGLHGLKLGFMEIWNLVQILKYAFCAENGCFIGFKLSSFRTWGKIYSRIELRGSMRSFGSAFQDWRYNMSLCCFLFVIWKVGYQKTTKIKLPSIIQNCKVLKVITSYDLH